jgi:CelD/BcsL family acetyltransferase involved in cellulose biosynthesis
MTTDRYRVDALDDPGEIARLTGGSDAGGFAWSAFQSAAWLTAWYAELVGPMDCVPCIRVVRRLDSGEIAAIVPLIARRKGPLRVIEAADLGISDYNAPILGPAAPEDREGAGALWQALVESLPSADLVHLNKMPVTVAGRVNPLALLASVTPSVMFGNVLTVEAGVDAFLHARGRKFRKEYHRYFRRLEDKGRVRLHRVTDAGRVSACLEQLDYCQGLRIRAQGKPYVLDQPHFAAHYRRLVEDGLAGEQVHLFELTVDEQPAAFLLGLAHAGTFSVIRLTHVTDTFDHCSPGRIMLIESMRALTDLGCKRIDLTIGDYRFKRDFEPAPYPLVDLLQPLGWRGSLAIGYRSARRQLKSTPGLARAATFAGFAVGSGEA